MSSTWCRKMFGTTFTFLGFTYIWGKSRAGLVTAKNRYSRAADAWDATASSERG